MILWMYILLVFIIFQRVTELYIARKNEVWMKERGGIEKGARHYKLFILLHMFFFVSILAETANVSTPRTFSLFLFILFIVAQLCRVWCISTLGKFWNTKIIILPNVSIIKKGPYKYIKHPNYIIVGIELFIIPFMFGAYLTAVIFPILHILLLLIRIPAENKALGKISTIRN